MFDHEEQKQTVCPEIKDKRRRAMTLKGKQFEQMNKRYERYEQMVIVYELNDKSDATQLVLMNFQIGN